MTLLLTFPQDLEMLAHEVRMLSGKDVMVDYSSTSYTLRFTVTDKTNFIDIRELLSANGFTYRSALLISNQTESRFTYARLRSSIGPERLASTLQVAGSSPAGGTILLAEGSHLAPKHSHPHISLPPPQEVDPMSFQAIMDEYDYMDDEHSYKAKAPKVIITPPPEKFVRQVEQGTYKLVDLFTEGQRLAIKLAEAREAKQDSLALIERTKNIVASLDERISSLTEEITDVTRRTAELLNLKTSNNRVENKSASPLGRAVKLDEE